MSTFKKIDGTSKNTFKIGVKKQKIDATNASTTRTFTLPDGDVNLNSGAVGDVLTKNSATTFTFQTPTPSVSTYDANLVGGRIIPLYNYVAGTLISNLGDIGAAGPFAQNIDQIIIGKNGRTVLARDNTTGSIQVFELYDDKICRVNNGAAGMIAGDKRAISMSNDCRFIAAANSATPKITWAERNRATFTGLTSPADPTGTPYISAWSPDGSYLAVAQTIAPRLLVYFRTGTTLSLATVTTPPSATIQSMSWSPDGSYLAVAINASPYILIYNFSGKPATFNLLAAPATPPTGTISGITWHPSSGYIALLSNLDQKIYLYSNSAGILTAITITASNSTPAPQSFKFSPKGDKIFVLASPNNFVYDYSNGDLVSRVSFAASSSPNDCDWTPDQKSVIFTDNTLTGKFGKYDTTQAAPVILDKAPKILYSIGNRKDW